MRPFLQAQPEDAPCHDDRDPLLKGKKIRTFNNYVSFKEYIRTASNEDNNKTNDENMNMKSIHGLQDEIIKVNENYAYVPPRSNKKC